MTHYRAIPCSCDDETCKAWMVEPGLAVQGVRLTEKQAKYVAMALNGEAVLIPFIARSHALRASGEVEGKLGYSCTVLGGDES